MSLVKQKQQLEEQLAKLITSQIKLITRGDTGQTYIYNQGVYELLTENQLNQYVIEEFQKNQIIYNRNKRNLVIDFIKSNTYIPNSEIENSEKNIINLSNGIYYLDKKIERYRQNEENNNLESFYSHFRPHPVESVYSFNQLPIDYNPDAKCPIIDKFMEDVFGKNFIDLVYEFIGYLLLPHVRYQRALIMIGSGKNGKTTFLDLLLKFLGLKNIAQIPLQNFSDKFEMINLRNKFANIVSDLPSSELKDSGNIKRIITDSTLSGCIKLVQGNFVFNNRCKLLFSCNELPKTLDRTLAFYRRWILFICDNVFDEDTCDTEILLKMCTKEELSGLFNRAIEGIKRLIKNKGFKETAKEVRDIWDIESNPVGVFISKRCIRAVNKEIKSTVLFEHFNNYRVEKKLPILDYRRIGYWLRQYGIIGKQKYDENLQKWFTYYQDLKIKEKYVQKKLDEL